MLENTIKTKLSDYLATAFTATSTTYVTALFAYLAPNTTYEVDCTIFLTGGSDGVRYSFQYGGTLENSSAYLTVHTTSTLSLTTINAITITPVLSGTVPIRFQGTIRTGSTGILQFSLRKNTDAGADTVVEAGSYLIARPSP
jgi:hypothetical protein